MATLSKAQFKEQLKDPEVASIKRNIHLLRKTIKELGCTVTSHNDKKYKCFELSIMPRINYTGVRDEQYFDEVCDTVNNVFKNCCYLTFVNDMGNLLEITLPYGRPKD